MSKELINGREWFDGEPVEIYELRFLGPVYMNEKDAAPLCNGDQVTLMVTVTLGDPKFTHVRKSGELKRSNGAKVTNLIAFDPEEAKFIYDNLGASVEGVNDGLIATKGKVAEKGEEPQMFTEEFQL